MADDAEDEGLEVSPMPEDAQAALKDILPFASPRNPVDVTAQFFNDLSLIPQFTRAMLDQGGYDALIGFWTSVAGSPVLGGPLLNYLKETMADYPDRLFLHVMLAPDEMVRQYDEAGFPSFEDPSRAIRALAALVHFGESFAASPIPLPALPAKADLGTQPLGESEAKAILAELGLPVVSDELATSASEAKRITARFACPVAIKIASPDIAHKTEIGGVALNIESADAAGVIFTDMMTSVRAAMPTARVDGALISPIVEEGVDCILGAKIDPVFGPVVLFGLGGIFTEVMNDVAFRRAPFGVETAHEMIEQLRGMALLKGARGQPPVDLDALASAIAKMSLFAAANTDQIESVEMNPLRAQVNGCIALDALIIRKDSR
jgi:acyl-CoA synthetase (NDP forming)